MPIRPIDIRRKEFRNGFRGYDANQVDDFLDTVADEFERNYNENQRMREETNSLRERLQQFEDLEGSIRAALVHAEQAANDLRRSANREAEDVRQSARREAEYTVKDAQSRSHQILADSASRIERVQDSYEALQDAKRSFANDFRHLLKTYMDMMENMEVSSAREIEAALRERLDTESIAVVREASAQQEEAADEPAFGAAGADAADLDDPGATQPIETAPQAGATDTLGAEDQQGTGPLAEGPEEHRESDQETQILGPGESVTFGSETDEPQTAPAAESAPVEEPAAEGPVAEEPATTETETSTASGGATQGATIDEPGAAEEVEREESTLAEGTDSHEFFDRENREEEKDSRISRASRFLRRRD
ncbi:MAG: Cell division initiation protein DivIVA [uncultured Rubrobacteraceae bacterium]|uniref:Cell wall synthesis protein Wag31 n=1 Tax=uncultured Rubrobacteraceae bacterium TaxID=349277 RepID=A0A6J4PY05_9ACTN|nr:MAG: Cell division initiation protein DivIVA [uncultured Rubrobacteraceae bacterium]